jgi:hypothetical protein
MTPPDEPGAPPPSGAPPLPPSASAARPNPDAPTPGSPRVRRRHPLVFLLVGVIIGFVLGGAGGYLAFNGKTVTISNQTQPSPSASASASPTAAGTATPTVVAATPVSAPQGIVPCPAPTPTGQHQLGDPGGPGSGQAQAAGLDFCGGGNAVIPTGSTRFLTGNAWGVGIADSCPVGASGQAGMNTVLTVAEIAPGGGLGPDTATEVGDWVERSTVLMATGGDYQLRVTTVSPSCVWHIKIYTSGA